MTINGTDGDDVLTGTAASDHLVGGRGNDVLDGLAGADITDGGLGNDSHYVDNAQDTVVERAGEGLDTVYTTISYVLAANVESLRARNAAGTAGLLLTGNELNNSIYGNAGNNGITGGAGADFMAGRGGDDGYVVDDSGDVAQELTGEGRDTVFITVNYRLGANIEVLRPFDWAGTTPLLLTGNELNNSIYGNAGNNGITGGAGADFMAGRGGNDGYVVDNNGDVTYELPGEGRDTVFTTVNYRLGANIEVLRPSDWAGTTPLLLTGNELNNSIYGNAGNNALTGGAGADFMAGRGGNDGYAVDSAGDTAYELPGEGHDTVFTTVNYKLGANVEVLRPSDLAGTTPLLLIGNDLNNTIYGNAGNNALTGGAGADFMAGRGGNDGYAVDNIGDVAYELAGEGQDTVYTTVDYRLGANIEVLRPTDLAGTAPLLLTGNDLNNTLYGNAGSNTLDGCSGADFMAGRGGSDTFAFTTALSASNSDVIQDFSVSDDLILLGAEAGQPFSALNSGSLLPSAFVIGSGPVGTRAVVIYDPATGALMYDADGTGAGAATIQFASVTPGLGLTSADFFVAGPPNTAPTVTSEATASVAENSDASTIVYQAAASDPENDALSFSLGGQDAGKMSIDAATGAVRLLNSPNFETQTGYRFSVTATDAKGLSGSKDVTLSVTDVQEGTPVIAEQSAANDSLGQAQLLNRSLFRIADNGLLPNDDLPSGTIQGNLSSSIDTDFFSITLQAGELLILDVDNAAPGFDPLLKVYGPGGALLGEADDSPIDPGSSAKNVYTGDTLDSFVRFRAPTTGTYAFSIEDFDSTQNGSYRLHVSVGPQATAAELIEEDILAVTSGFQWDETSVTYGFPALASDYDRGYEAAGTEEESNFQPLSTLQQNAVGRIISGIGQYINLEFRALPSNFASTMDLRYAMSDLPDTAYAFYPSADPFLDPVSGDSWYNNSGGEYDNPVLGNYAWMAFAHETGHALGLRHGHEFPAIRPDRDSIEYSVMSYRSYPGAPIDDGGYTNETFGYAQSLMMYDIAALQRMYGADFTANGGDTVYSWLPVNGTMSINGVAQPRPGESRVFLTIWDGGGNDTYDLSNYSNSVTIDLRPGEWTTTAQAQLANLGDGHFARGNVANALLYNGDTRSLIENAVGGLGSDVLIGNRAQNHLTGGGDVDTFRFLSTDQSPSGVLADILTDFISGGDRIDLSAIDANSQVNGDQAFTYIGVNAFTGIAGQLRTETVGSSVHAFADVNGDAIADLQIIVNPSMAGTAVVNGYDFVL